MNMLKTHSLTRALATLPVVFLALCARAEYQVVGDADAIALGGASGGDEIRKIDNGDGTVDLIHIFSDTSSTSTFSIPADARIIPDTFRLLVVGGGGSGGSAMAGGGGGGGVIALDNLDMSLGSSATVTVGAGGARPVSAGDGNANAASQPPGLRGSDSVFAIVGGDTHTALGGGGGASWAAYAAENPKPGSGGGASGQRTNGSKGTDGQGNSGGTGLNHSINGSSSNTNGGGGGGGGGAGGVGGNAIRTDDSQLGGKYVTGGKGGDGIASDITGEVLYYGAGGGGGSAWGYNGGNGAYATGGAGGKSGDGTGDWGKGANRYVTIGNTGSGTGKPVAGQDGFGGGGGGGTFVANDASNAKLGEGAKGGSGVVIVRYTARSGSVIAYSGEVKKLGYETVLIFTNPAASSAFVLPGPAKVSILAVGGGGAGGSGATGAAVGSGAGGGAGGFLEVTNVIEAGTYTVKVGAGGAAATDNSTATAGANGSDSFVTFDGNDIVRALGGGGGGARSDGNAGGSGGGASRTGVNGGAANQPSSAFGGLGNKGGDSGSYLQAAGGGGGAGGEGSPATAVGVSGNGGPGVASVITGAEVWYAGGGGGGSRTTSPGTGGKGGGGDGMNTTGSVDGVDGTGGGGGGGNNNGPGGKGGDGIVVVRVQAVLDGPIVKPVADSIVYDGEEHVKIQPADFAYTITGDYAATHVGDYHLKVELKSGFTWSDGTTDTVEIDWHITKAPNEITDLALKSWQLGKPANSPTCTAAFGSPVYTYSTSEEGPWEATRPSALGDYWVRATVEGTADYAGAEAKAQFSIVSGPADLFHNSVDIAVGNLGNAAPVADFPVVVKISEAGMPGFKYSEMADPVNGSDLRFAGEDGNYYDYEVETWDTSGESIVWVKLPSLPVGGTTFGMYWNPKGAGFEPNTPANVWDGYVGVWHMAEASGNVADATGHGLNGVPTGNYKSRMVATAGVVGNARINTDVNNLTGGNSGHLLIPSYDSFNVGGVFTFSGWYKANSTNGYQRLVSRKNKHDDANGWEVEMVDNSATSSTARGSDSTPSVKYKLPNITNDWVYLSWVYNDTKLTIYANGAYATNGTIHAATDNGRALSIGNNANGSERSFNGQYDECRLYKGTLTADRIKAEYEMMKPGSTAVTPGMVSEDGVTKNYWKTEPALSKRQWDAGQEAAVVTMGVPALGECVLTYTVRQTGEELPGMPTTKGDFLAVFSVEGTDTYSSLRAEIDFSIIDHSPYSDVDGAQGANGRVLLMNRDLGNPVVEYQGWYDNSTRYSTMPTFWQHCNDDAGSVNLMAGTESILWTANYGKKLWHLMDCRHGNTFPAAGTGTNGLISAQAYLPWSATSKRINAHTPLSITRQTVGQCVMRNVEDAAIYSSCFEDGIGTIYFDVANGWVNNVGGVYNFVVEVATNTVADLPPVDDNLWQEHIEYDITPLDDGGEITNSVTITTNWYERAMWHQVPMVPLKRDYPADYDGDRVFVQEEPVEEFEPAIENGGTTNNFYRVYVPVNFRGPIRFRIRRVGYKSGMAADGDALLLFDNIIVSYPTMYAELGSYGIYDEQRDGKLALGQEGAWSVPFPSVSDTEIIVRAKPEYYVNPAVEADTSEFVTSARMHYRWRYLDQKTEPWREVALDPKNGFNALAPLELPGLVGDVEFWYDLHQQTPFYDYVDYSGTGLKLGGFYTEEVTEVVSASDGGPYQSQGTNWFVRLRDGKSDIEGIRIIARRIDEYGDQYGADDVVEMEVVGNHVWRGYVKTTSAAPGGLRYRFEAYNEQTPGSTEWVVSTNFWHSRNDAAALPVSETVVSGSEGDWATVPCDATTGYLMFQLDDSTKSLTIVHADYQNFNGWNDANKGGVFVGCVTEDDGKAGVSPKAVEWSENFRGWQDMPATNHLWCESFTTTVGQEYDDYVTFPSWTTPNGWTAGQGMSVFGLYRVKGSGHALQMEGQGRGYLQFVDATKSPRGLESVSFTARLGQFINFEDFAYYDGDSKLTMTNYAFMTRSAFDLSDNKGFSGNASLSMVAYYRPKVGCYEARWEWVSTNSNTGARNTCLSLYRWNFKQGKKEKVLLGVWTNKLFNSDVKATKINTTAKFTPIMISVSNENNGVTFVTAMVKNNYGEQSGQARNIWWGNTGETLAGGFAQSGQWVGICYRDGSPDALRSGTYGVLPTNCEGFFGRPELYEPMIWDKSMYERESLPAVLPLNTPMSPTHFNSQGKEDSSNYAVMKVNVVPVNMSTARSCFANEGDEIQWVIDDGRMQFATNNNYALRGIQAHVYPQALSVYTAPAGKTDWRLLATTNFAGFGSSTKSGERCEFKVYTTEDCSVKIAAAGSVDDVRTDLVIDDVELRQWRGDSWYNEDEMSKYIPNWTTEENYKAHTNFVFTSGWIKNQSMLLSAKRTAEGTPCSIRSPLFDGRYDRGIGLGMFAFSYTNAQPNVKLLLQVATNVTYDTVNDVTRGTAAMDDATWTTVTNFDFSVLSAADRAKGVRSCYIGLHGVSGVMRLIMDPAVVSAVSNETDVAKFGDIYITDVFCRDEPTLDAGCWWGWNLRTFGQDVSTGKDLEKRMYLPDFALTGSMMGMSLALNNSTNAVDNPNEASTYQQHLPFVQTPTFTSNIVGEVAFKARKYAAGDPGYAQVTLYGSRIGGQDGRWELLKCFIVSNDTFAPYSFKTEPNDAYAAFRLAVTGVEGVNDPSMRSQAPESGGDPLRVVVDEVLVSEAVRARVAFRNVGAFRSDMSGTAAVPNVPSPEEQPLCNESWGVQCEVYAAQLPDEIDFNRNPVVKLYWYEGESPWGFDNWKNSPGCHSAYLASASGTNLVYRSSYRTAEGAVIPMSTTPGTTVQYMLEAVYYQVGSSKPVTNRMELSDWKLPEWYHPLDLNRTLGNNNSDFAAYTILDTVAPGWAWINEVNLFGDFDRSWDNSDEKYQYVEVAVPAESDISGWRVNVLESQNGNGMVVTNTLGIFGEPGLPGTKPGLKGMDENSSMVFRVLANSASKLKYDDGTLDGLWDFNAYPNHITMTFSAGNEILADNPIGLQLVRASGIVEQEFVVEGTNTWIGLPGYEDEYHPTNTVRLLNSAMPDARFFYLGCEDDGGIENSVGVFQSRGESPDAWNNTMVHTPGRINGGQTIDGRPPSPNGSSVLVFCNLGDIGHVRQTVGEGVDTNGSVVVAIEKGHPTGTNITYRVDPWYELGTVTTNGRPAAVTKLAEPRTYVVTVGAHASNNVTVVASAKVSDHLQNLGVTDDNKYKPAILDWLSNHQDAYGNDWADSEADEVKLAKFLKYPTGAVVGDMSITEMYWLDMDPTVGGLALEGGISRAATPFEVDGHPGVTNISMEVFMMITNLADDAASPEYGKAWTPYVLRGLDPGVTSWDYAAPTCSWNWTSETFQVQGILLNGRTSYRNPENWSPLRWFVFTPDSFRQPGAHDRPFTATIDFMDPFSPGSPIGSLWINEVLNNGPCSAAYSWRIETRRRPFAIEVLKTENSFNYED